VRPSGFGFVFIVFGVLVATALPPSSRAEEHTIFYDCVREGSQRINVIVSNPKDIKLSCVFTCSYLNRNSAERIQRACAEEVLPFARKHLACHIQDVKGVRQVNEVAGECWD